jgi:hypothetical protein
MRCVAVRSRDLRRGDEVVLCAAFLVGRDRRAQFETCIGRVMDECGRTLKCRYAGPLPPYSFVGLSLVMLSADRIEAARTLLGIPERACVQEIKRAYRKAARECHPDLHQEDAAAAPRFQRLTEALGCLLGLASSATADELTPVSLRHRSGPCRAVVAMETE